MNNEIIDFEISQMIAKMIGRFFPYHLSAIFRWRHLSFRVCSKRGGKRACLRKRALTVISLNHSYKLQCHPRKLCINCLFDTVAAAGWLVSFDDQLHVHRSIQGWAHSVFWVNSFTHPESVSWNLNSKMIGTHQIFTLDSGAEFNSPLACVNLELIYGHAAHACAEII